MKMTMPEPSGAFSESKNRLDWLQAQVRIRKPYTCCRIDRDSPAWTYVSSTHPARRRNPDDVTSGGAKCRGRSPLTAATLR